VGVVAREGGEVIECAERMAMDELYRRVRAIPVDPDPPDAVDELIRDLTVHRIAGGPERQEDEEWTGDGPDPNPDVRVWQRRRTRYLDYLGGW
jgi:hypothetical protein